MALEQSLSSLRRVEFQVPIFRIIRVRTPRVMVFLAMRAFVRLCTCDPSARNQECIHAATQLTGSSSAARANTTSRTSIVEIPRDKLVVFTGLSGSGKSSLAFDTIYAEGQRRYVESLSAYARQFLGQMEKPDVDHIEGLSPAISIDQKGTSRNPRSTVGTVTEIYDYLRLLYARVGHPHCPNCGRRSRQQRVQQMADAILALPEARG